MKSRPFPWRCPRCRLPEVAPAIIPYRVEVRHDNILHLLDLPRFEVPRCGSCGELVLGNDADEQINEALRSKLHLLKPDDISNSREGLSISRDKLAECLGISLEQLSDWEEGTSLPSRSMDRFMRVYFALPEVRDVLSDCLVQDSKMQSA